MLCWLLLLLFLVTIITFVFFLLVTHVIHFIFWYNINNYYLLQPNVLDHLLSTIVVYDHFKHGVILSLGRISSEHCSDFPPTHHRSICMVSHVTGLTPFFYTSRFLLSDGYIFSSFKLLSNHCHIKTINITRTFLYYTFCGLFTVNFYFQFINVSPAHSQKLTF